jgi:acyl carrier protein
MPELNDIEQRVKTLLLEAVGNSLDVESIQVSAGLRSAGVPSSALISLLVGVENAFGFEWDEDTPVDVFHSMASIAGYIAVRTGKGH